MEIVLTQSYTVDTMGRGWVSLDAGGVAGEVEFGPEDYHNLESKLRKHFKEGVISWVKCYWEIKKRPDSPWIGNAVVIQGKVKTVSEENIFSLRI